MASDLLTKFNILLKCIKLFKNWYVYPLIYFKLIKKEYVVFETKNGLKIKIRVNSTDLMALTHVWIIQEYYKENYELLLENIKLNNIENIFPYNVAVTKTTSHVKIFRNDDESGHSMFLDNENFVTVDSKSLNDIFLENEIHNCDFLKLDCEGAEYEIIDSILPDLIKKIKKTVIEYHLADKKPELLERLIHKLQKASFNVNTRPLFSDIGFLFGIQK